MKTQPEKKKNKTKNQKTYGGAAKAALEGKFRAIQAHFKKQEKSQINNLTLHLKQLEKEEMKNPGLIQGKKS